MLQKIVPHTFFKCFDILLSLNAQIDRHTTVALAASHIEFFCFVEEDVEVAE
jgi:hypothetical protein